MNDPETRPRRRPQFSLLTLMLMTSIVALAITVVMLYREVGPLRRELKQLRDETGQLTIDDATKLHAIRVDTQDELEWKWRIWVPKGAQYRLRAEGGSIPEQGYPDSGGTIVISEPGEYVVRYLIRRDPRSGEWRGSLHLNSGSVGEDPQPWVDWSTRSISSSGVGTSTQSFDTDQTVELIRHRVSQQSQGGKLAEPVSGFAVWLQPK
ncbi:MAG: hypothetical protein R3C10_20515 [Pirellulales bacterium]